MLNQIYSYISLDLQYNHAKYGENIKTTKLAMELKLFLKKLLKKTLQVFRWNLPPWYQTHGTLTSVFCGCKLFISLGKKKIGNLNPLDSEDDQNHHALKHFRHQKFIQLDKIKELFLLVPPFQIEFSSMIGHGCM